MPWLLAKYSLWVCLDKISIRMGGLSKDHPTDGLKRARTEEGWVLPLLPLFLSALLELGQSWSPTYTCKFLVLRLLGLDWILPPSYLHLLCEPTRVSFYVHIHLICSVSLQNFGQNTLYNPPTFSSSSCFFFAHLFASLINKTQLVFLFSLPLRCFCPLQFPSYFNLLLYLI